MLESVLDEVVYRVLNGEYLYRVLEDVESRYNLGRVDRISENENASDVVVRSI